MIDEFDDKERDWLENSAWNKSFVESFCMPQSLFTNGQSKKPMHSTSMCCEIGFGYFVLFGIQLEFQFRIPINIAYVS